MTNKKDILLKLGLLAGIFLVFNSFKNKDKNKKVTRKGNILIDQIDAPTGSQQVYSKIGTQLFDKNKNLILTYDYDGAGMTVTGYNNGIYSVVYGDTFYNGLPAYVNASDVQVFDSVTVANPSNLNEM
jgi:hypothetical protein